MALVKLSSLLSEASGKLNGSFFKGNSGAISLCTKSSIKSNRSRKQNVSTLYADKIYQAWLSLSEVNRKSWLNSSVAC